MTLNELETLLSEITPGPWRTDDRRDKVEIVGKANAIRFGVAGEWTIASIDADEFEEETVQARANARFIVAAPEIVRDLLEVAKAAEAYMHAMEGFADEIRREVGLPYPWEPQDITRARLQDALAKAQGKV